MKKLALLSFVALSFAGCIADQGTDVEGEDTDAEKAARPEQCKLEQVIAKLNTGISYDALREAGVAKRPARFIVEHRNGADETFGTADDDLFDTVDELDDVQAVGNAALRDLAEGLEAQCPVPADIYTEARDVNKAVIKFHPDAQPQDYQEPGYGDFSLGGTEFWQKWSGGHNPTYSYEEGTAAGRLCMQASAIRFETIMANPPAELVALAANSNWDGSFFNWNDDFSGPNAYGNASSANLWAWQTYLIKWMSQTAKDGSCHLPTLDKVISAAKKCQQTADANNGEIKGCRS